MSKGVGFDSCVLVRHEDSRVSFKYQTLLQDYHELQKETKAARSKLEAMKLKKLTLQAEVRFLRRRHKFLLKNKSSTPSHMLHGVMQHSHRRATQAFDLNQMVKINSFDVVGLDKDAIVKTRVATFDLNQKLREEEEEEELQEGYEPDNLVRSVNDEKVNEFKLSMCRNIVRDASTSQGKKRNISWQDHVALRV